MTHGDHFGRRSFLQSTALALAAAQTAARASAPAPDSVGWFDRPMRWAQLTPVEDDPGRGATRFSALRIRVPCFADASLLLSIISSAGGSPSSPPDAR